MPIFFFLIILHFTRLFPAVDAPWQEPAIRPTVFNAFRHEAFPNLSVYALMTDVLTYPLLILINLKAADRSA